VELHGDPLTEISPDVLVAVDPDFELDGPTVRAINRMSPEKEYEPEWRDLARVLGQPMPYWPFALRDPDLIEHWTPSSVTVQTPAIDRLAVAGTPAQVAEQLRRYDGVLDHVIVYPPSLRLTPQRCDELVDGLITHAAPVSTSVDSRMPWSARSARPMSVSEMRGVPPLPKARPSELGISAPPGNC
jgi:hypothetical protein